MFPVFESDHKIHKKKCVIYKKIDGTEKQLNLNVHRSFLLFRLFNNTIPESFSPLVTTKLSNQDMRVVYKCVLYSYLSYKDRSIIDFPPEIKIEFERNDSNVGRIPFFIATDRSINAIVVSLRGSSCMDDFITDSMGNGVSYNNGKFHEGIFSTANYVFMTCQTKLLELNEKYNSNNNFENDKSSTREDFYQTYNDTYDFYDDIEEESEYEYDDDSEDEKLNDDLNKFHKSGSNENLHYYQEPNIEPKKMRRTTSNDNLIELNSCIHIKATSSSNLLEKFGQKASESKKSPLIASNESENENEDESKESKKKPSSSLASGSKKSSRSKANSEIISHPMKISEEDEQNDNLNSNEMAKPLTKKRSSSFSTENSKKLSDSSKAKKSKSKRRSSSVNGDEGGLPKKSKSKSIESLKEKAQNKKLNANDSTIPLSKVRSSSLTNLISHRPDVSEESQNSKSSQTKSSKSRSKSKSKNKSNPNSNENLKESQDQRTNSGIKTVSITKVRSSSLTNLITQSSIIPGESSETNEESQSSKSSQSKSSKSRSKSKSKGKKNSNSNSNENLKESQDQRTNSGIKTVSITKVRSSSLTNLITQSNIIPGESSETNEESQSSKSSQSKSSKSRSRSKSKGKKNSNSNSNENLKENQNSNSGIKTVSITKVRSSSLTNLIASANTVLDGSPETNEESQSSKSSPSKASKSRSKSKSKTKSKYKSNEDLKDSQNQELKIKTLPLSKVRSSSLNNLIPQTPNYQEANSETNDESQSSKSSPSKASKSRSRSKSKTKTKSNSNSNENLKDSQNQNLNSDIKTVPLKKVRSSSLTNETPQSKSKKNSSIISHPKPENSPRNRRANSGRNSTVRRSISLTNMASYLQQRASQGSDLITKVNNKKKLKIIFTGHSLGAGVAAVVAYLFREKFPDLDVEAICFAPPPTLSFNLWKSTGTYIKSFMIEGDLVPFLSVMNLMKISDILFPRGHANKAFKNFIVSYLEKSSRLNYAKIENLYPPGQMYLIRFTHDEEDGFFSKKKKNEKNKRKTEKIKGDKIQLCQILNPDYFSNLVKNIQENNHFVKNYMRLIIRLMHKFKRNEH